MMSESTASPRAKLSAEEKTNLRQQVIEACEPISPIWPLKTFAYRSPVRGFEHLPFDQAARQGAGLLGGRGYLPNQEYRQFYRDGRITDASVREALVRVGPRVDTPPVRAGSREITSSEVFHLHLIHGIESLEPALWRWTETSKESFELFRRDLDEQSKARILQKLSTGNQEISQDPERWYVSQLWCSTLAKLGLADADADGLRPDDEEASSPARALPPQRTVSDWLDALTGSSLVEKVNDQLMKWAAAFLDEGLAGWEMPS